MVRGTMPGHECLRRETGVVMLCCILAVIGITVLFETAEHTLVQSADFCFRFFAFAAAQLDLMTRLATMRDRHAQRRTRRDDHGHAGRSAHEHLCTHARRHARSFSRPRLSLRPPPILSHQAKP